MRRATGAADGAQEESQSYLATVSDLMAGLIFVFILTLMIFASRFQAAESRLKSTVATRDTLITAVGNALIKRGLKVVVNADQGVLTFTEDAIRFKQGYAQPDSSSFILIDTIAAVLGRIIPCFVAYTDSTLVCQSSAIDTAKLAGKIEALMVEGHTDTVPISAQLTRDKGYKNNLELSGARASAVWQRLVQGNPGLVSLANSSRKPILSIAGYGDLRLADTSNPGSASNRRIDIRFIMEPLPDEHPPEPVNEVKGGLPGSANSSGR